MRKLIGYRLVDECAAYLARPARPSLGPCLTPTSQGLFLTFGDWGRNGGPVPILQVTEGVGTEVVLDKAFTEAIERIQDIDGTLYATYTDPRDNGRPDRRGLYFYAKAEHGQWRNAGALPFDFTHVFGVVKFREKVMAYGARDYDGCITDTHPDASAQYLHLPRPPGTYLLRILDARVTGDVDGYPGVIYLRCQVWGSSGGYPLTYLYYRWDGDNPPVQVSAAEAGPFPADGTSKRGYPRILIGGTPPAAALYPEGQCTYAEYDGRLYTIDARGVLACWEGEA